MKFNDNYQGYRENKLAYLNYSLIFAALIFFLGLFWLSIVKAFLLVFVCLSFTVFFYGMKYGAVNTRNIQLDEYSNEAVKTFKKNRLYIWCTALIITYFPAIMLLPLLMFEGTDEINNDLFASPNIQGLGVYDNVADKLARKTTSNSSIYLKLYSNSVFIGLMVFTWFLVWKFLDIVRVWLDWGYYATWVRNITDESSSLRVFLVLILCFITLITSVLLLFTNIKLSELIDQARQWDEVFYFCLYFFEAGLLIGGWVLFSFFVFGLLQPIIVSLGASIKNKVRFKGE